MMAARSSRSVGERNRRLGDGPSRRVSKGLQLLRRNRRERGTNQGLSLDFKGVVVRQEYSI
jgi:hypothetical protein